MSALPWSIAALGAALESGSLTSAQLLADVRERADGAAGTGVFIARRDDAARAEAARWDAERQAGGRLPPLAGLPVTIKDCFDCAGEVTRAGSIVLDGAAPATVDAEAVRLLRAAGAVITGRTNMSEFAYTGLGLNPHYGNPANPHDAARLPGGSSSGAAVSVANRLAVVALGSDTGGSIRVPAALCGLTGFKPTQARVSRAGMLPLSTTLDVAGWMGRTVDDCARLDAVLTGDAWSAKELLPTRLAIPEAALRDLDAGVANAFAAALTALSDAGVRVVELAVPELDEIAAILRTGGFSAYEAARWHGERLDRQADAYDPVVLGRLLMGRSISDADYAQMQRRRRELMASFDARTTGFDGLLLPTVPIIAPRFDAVGSVADATRLGGLLLRNASPYNFLDRGAISLPIGPVPGIGAMLVGRRNADRDLLASARGVEAALAAG